MLYGKIAALVSELPTEHEFYGDGSGGQLSHEELEQLEKCLKEINWAMVRYSRKSMAPIIVRLPENVFFCVVRVLSGILKNKGFTGDTSFYQDGEQGFWKVSLW